MAQTQFNSVMISVHKEYTDQLDLVDFENEFIRETHHIFGTYLKSEVILIH